MGDAGASSMILLVTSLLVSGIAGAVIVEEWGKAIEVVQDAEHKNRYAQEFDVDFAGDMCPYNLMQQLRNWYFTYSILGNMTLMTALSRYSSMDQKPMLEEVLVQSRPQSFLPERRIGNRDIYLKLPSPTPLGHLTLETMYLCHLQAYLNLTKVQNIQ